MSLVRAFPENSGGVAKLDLAGLPPYEVIDLDNLVAFRTKVIEAVERVSNAHIVGSGATRIWMDLANLPVPAERSGDIDVVVPARSTDQVRAKLRVGEFILDRFGGNAVTELGNEHFTNVNYQGQMIRLAHFPRIYAYKMRNLFFGTEDSDSAAKDEFYAELCHTLTDRTALAKYVKDMAKSPDGRARNTAEMLKKWEDLDLLAEQKT